MVGSLLNKQREIKNLMFQVSYLVDLSKEKNRKLLTEIEKWLKQAEEVLKENNYSETSEISGLRSRLYMTQYEEGRKTAKTKKQMALAVDLIYPSQSILTQLIKPLDEKINEAYELSSELISAAKEAGIIDTNNIADFNTFIQSLLGYFQKHEQLQGHANRIVSLLGRSDTLRLLAEQMT